MRRRTGRRSWPKDKFVSPWVKCASQQKLQCRFPPEEVRAALARHARGDWGDLEEIDRAQNECHLQQGGVLLSGFRTRNGLKYWILTEWDRTVTTVLFTEEY